MRAIVALGVVAGLVFAACGRQPFDPVGVEIIGSEVESGYNAQINIPLPAWVVSDLASRPRSKIAASDSGVAGADSSIYVTINNLSRGSVRTVYLAVDLANAIASASVNIEVGATVFQGFYRDRDGIVIYQSSRIVANIEKGKPYQVNLKMTRAAVAPANVNVTWDTASVKGEPVIIPRPPPPSPPSLTLLQTAASAYYIYDGRERLEFLTVVAISSEGDTVESGALDIAVVGSLARFPVDTLVVIEKLAGGDVLLFKVQGAAFFTGAMGKLRLRMIVPEGTTRTLMIGGIIARKIDLSELINQNIGFSITAVEVKYPAAVSTRLPLGQAVPLSFISETGPVLLPQL